MSNHPAPARDPQQSPFDDRTRVYLKAFAEQFPTAGAALAEIAHLRAILTLPKGTIHVVSDVHGEFKKLKHIINNASGTLRPLVDEVFGDRLGDAERHELLNMIYYPSETFAYVVPRFASQAERRTFLDRKSTRLNSSHMSISYAVFCLK